MTTLQAFDVKVTMRDVFKRFKSPMDAMRNQREQRELYEKFVGLLEIQRKRESGEREFSLAQVSKNMLALVRKELRSLALRSESERQLKECQWFAQGGAKIGRRINQAEQAKLDKTYRICDAKTRKQLQRHQNEKESLEREIAAIPIPRSRYTKGTLGLQHAEKLLSVQQDYYNASLVRVKTKKFEAEEDIATAQEHERKMQHKRDLLAKTHEFENNRQFEDCKNQRMVGRRTHKAAVKLGRNRISFLEAGMMHGHTMSQHMVLGTTHNVGLEPRKPSHHTTRGTSYKELHVGKAFNAIPSMSYTHLFDTKPANVEKARPQSAKALPNFRDPATRMAFRLAAARPQSTGVDGPQQRKFDTGTTGLGSTTALGDADSPDGQLSPSSGMSPSGTQELTWSPSTLEGIPQE